MAQPTTPISPFQVNQSRRLFIQGDDWFVHHIRGTLKALDYLVYTPWNQYTVDASHQHVIIFSCNFNKPESVQNLAKSFAENYSPLAYKVIYVTEPTLLRREPLLFAAEIGARFTVHGHAQDEHLRQHMKSIMFQDAPQNSLLKLEEELYQGQRAGDRDSAQRVLQKLEKYNKNQEDVLRVLILTYEMLDKPKQVEFYLKKVLQLNPQSLWAANKLGRFYLKRQDVARGIEILERLSQFHELNSERYYTLGNAYLNCGETDQAKKAFHQGEKLTAGKDERFQEGLCKAQLMEGDKPGALALLKGKPLSNDTISFLNMRAIMAMRLKKADEGFRLYELALDGAKTNNLFSAKLYFNMGLAYARQKDLKKAQACLENSTQLGGSQFQRAKQPLEIVNKVMTKKTTLPELDVGFEEVGWERLDQLRQS